MRALQMIRDNTELAAKVDTSIALPEMRVKKSIDGDSSTEDKDEGAT
jgi:hypothetical protein